MSSADALGNTETVVLDLPSTGEIDVKALFQSSKESKNEADDTILDTEDSPQKNLSVSSPTSVKPAGAKGLSSVILSLERRFQGGDNRDEDVDMEDNASVTGDLPESRKKNDGEKLTKEEEELAEHGEGWLDDTELEEAGERARQSKEVKTTHSGFYVNRGPLETSGYVEREESDETRAAANPKTKEASQRKKRSNSTSSKGKSQKKSKQSASKKSKAKSTKKAKPSTDETPNGLEKEKESQENATKSKKRKPVSESKSSSPSKKSSKSKRSKTAKSDDGTGDGSKSKKRKSSSGDGKSSAKKSKTSSSSKKSKSGKKSKKVKSSKKSKKSSKKSKSSDAESAKKAAQKAFLEKWGTEEWVPPPSTEQLYTALKIAASEQVALEEKMVEEEKANLRIVKLIKREMKLNRKKSSKAKRSGKPDTTTLNESAPEAKEQERKEEGNGEASKSEVKESEAKTKAEGDEANMKPEPGTDDLKSGTGENGEPEPTATEVKQQSPETSSKEKSEEQTNNKFNIPEDMESRKALIAHSVALKLPPKDQPAHLRDRLLNKRLPKKLESALIPFDIAVRHWPANVDTDENNQYLAALMKLFNFSKDTTVHHLKRLRARDFVKQSEASFEALFEETRQSILEQVKQPNGLKRVAVKHYELSPPAVRTRLGDSIISHLETLIAIKSKEEFDLVKVPAQILQINEILRKLIPKKTDGDPKSAAVNGGTHYVSPLASEGNQIKADVVDDKKDTPAVDSAQEAPGETATQQGAVEHSNIQNLEAKSSDCEVKADDAETAKSPPSAEVENNQTDQAMSLIEAATAVASTAKDSNKALSEAPTQEDQLVELRKIDPGRDPTSFKEFTSGVKAILLNWLGMHGIDYKRAKQNKEPVGIAMQTITDSCVMCSRGATLFLSEQSAVGKEKMAFVWDERSKKLIFELDTAQQKLYACRLKYFKFRQTYQMRTLRVSTSLPEEKAERAQYIEKMLSMWPKHVMIRHQGISNVIRGQVKRQEVVELKLRLQGGKSEAKDSDEDDESSLESSDIESAKPSKGKSKASASNSKGKKSTSKTGAKSPSKNAKKSTKSKSIQKKEKSVKKPKSDEKHTNSPTNHEPENDEGHRSADSGDGKSSQEVFENSSLNSDASDDENSEDEDGEVSILKKTLDSNMAADQNVSGDEDDDEEQSESESGSDEEDVSDNDSQL